MEQVFLSIEPDSELEEQYKIAILTIKSGTITGKTQVKKVLSEDTYDQEEAMERLRNED